MQRIMSFLDFCTLLHVVISLIGIGTGFVVLVHSLRAKKTASGEPLFLWTTVATSVTGYGFSRRPSLSLPHRRCHLARRAGDPRSTRAFGASSARAAGEPRT